MKRIPLNHGKESLVDDVDFALVSQYRWRARLDRNVWYAVRTINTRINGKHRAKMVLMHRMILSPPEGAKVDHWNGDGLDNQRANLRTAYDSQNQANRRPTKTNTSGYRGVTFHRQTGRWMARIQVRGRREHLGLHATAISAAKAYDERAVEQFGAFARLNFGGDA